MNSLKVIILFLILGFNYSFAQIAFKTGDSALDREMNTLNTSAKKDLSAFKEEMKVDYGIPGDRLDALLKKKMEPADIILAGRISKIAIVEFDAVINRYAQDKDKGWGHIAKEMGIKPGSPEFHELKNKPKKSGSSQSNGSNGKSSGSTKGSSSSSKGKNK